MAVTSSAESAVNAPLAPYTIVGGVPARPIRERFPRHIADRLQRIAWWDWAFALIMQRLAGIQSDDIEAFCARWDNGR